MTQLRTRIKGTKAPVSIELPEEGWKIDRKDPLHDTYCSGTNMTVAIWYEQAEPTATPAQAATILATKKAERVSRLLKGSTERFRVTFSGEKPVSVNNKVWISYDIQAVSPDGSTDLRLIIYTYSDSDKMLGLTGVATTRLQTGQNATVSNFLASAEAVGKLDKIMKTIRIEDKSTQN